MWSYDRFLENLKPIIIEGKADELSAIWRKRFLTALDRIINDDTKDEQVRAILQTF